jgi:molecular chaperone HtpG
MPDMFNIVLNSDHKLIKVILEDEEKSCKEAIEPLQNEMNDIDKQRGDLRKSHEGKKDEEIPTTEKDQLKELDNQFSELKKKKEAIFGDYAGTNKVINQLIDLALLQNGMLKGEALSKFVQRSIDLI